MQFLLQAGQHAEPQNIQSNQCNNPNPMKNKLALAFAPLAIGLIILTLSTTLSAAIGPVTSVVAGTPGAPPYQLESITVGGYTVPLSGLAVGTTEALPGGNDGGNFFNTWPPPFNPPAPCSNFDLNDILARNQNTNPVIVTNFGGAVWTNSNGANPDFFIFEAAASGNVDADVTVQAILPGDVLGVAVALPAGSWGVTGSGRVVALSVQCLVPARPARDGAARNSTSRLGSAGMWRARKFVELPF